MSGVTVGARWAGGAEADAVDALVRAAQADPSRFAALYRRYVGPVHRYVFQRVRDRDEAEDITAQAFADALAALPRYRERGEFAAWLFRIVRRRCADHFRRRPPQALGDRDVAFDPFGGLEAEIDRGALGRELRRLVDRLDPDKQELLNLRFAAGLTYPEIAAVLDRQPAAVKMAIHRLLDQMAEELEADHVHAH